VFTSTAWVTEEVKPIPKNIYGVTKTAAEDLCHLFHRQRDLHCVVLRTSSFFPEADDDKAKRLTYDDDNAKANELLSRRVDLADVVSAHLLASADAPAIGFGRYIISATTPFLTEDLAALPTNAPGVLRRRVPEYEPLYQRRGWKMLNGIDIPLDDTFTGCSCPAKYYTPTSAMAISGKDSLTPAGVDLPPARGGNSVRLTFCT
jgi:nucleoside-diphosphate-sugar epimerase